MSPAAGLTRGEEAGRMEAAAREALDFLRGRGGSGVEAEVYIEHARDRAIELREGHPHGVEFSSHGGVGVRVLREGRMASASAAGFKSEAVLEACRKALERLPFSEPDPARTLPRPPSRPAVDPALAASLWDETLFEESPESIRERIKAMEARALAKDPRVRKILRSGWGERAAWTLVANSRGVMAYERSGSASVGLSVLAGEGDQVEVGSASESACRKNALDLGRAADDAAFRSVALLGGRKLPPAKRDIIVDPWVAGEFLGLLAELLEADNVQRGKSLLAGKSGSRVASSRLSLIDDPRRPGGLGSSLYDAEGTPTQTRTMIDKGVLSGYFYDATTASREGKASNGCAGRGSYRSAPGPSPSNFYLAAGSAKRDEIIGSTKDGVLVMEVMGMHMVDTISGEFSIGISGLAVQGGRVAGPVKSAMMSGNLMELLDRVDAVADDLVFYGSYGAPTFRVAGLSVA